MDKIYAIVLGGLMEDVKAHPWATLSSLMALLLVIYTMKTHASSTDVADLKSVVEEIRISQLEDKIDSSLRRFCSSSNGQKEYFRQQVIEYSRQYEKFTGRHYVKPACTDLE